MVLANPATHHLKTWPVFFQAIKTGQKTFELRYDDRGFTEGDVLILDEFDPEIGHYTGDSLTFRSGFILNGGQFGLLPGWVIISLLPIERPYAAFEELYTVASLTT